MNSEYYFIKLLGTRPDWPENMTSSEEKIMEEHFDYLNDLVAKKKVVLAGPCLNPTFGLIIIRANAESDAREIMNAEPSVVQKLHTYEIQRMQVSLLQHFIPAGRYVENPSQRILHKDVIINAPVAEVWKTWTTDEGARRFFSDETNIELKFGGKYEIYFLLDAPEGLRGSEDCHILSFIPPTMLSIEWNAPPQFGKLRYQYTQVILHFEEISPTQTRVLFSQLGWGRGEEWDKLFNYFDRAWSMVLKNLQEALAREM